MGLLGKPHGHRSTPVVEVTEAPICIHTTLAPRWDSAADLGIEDKISGYRCDGCRSVFTSAEGKLLRATEEARLKSTAFAR